MIGIMPELTTLGSVIKEIGLPSAMIAFLLWDMVVERRRMANKFEKTIDLMFRRFNDALVEFRQALERQEERNEKGRNMAADRILAEFRKLPNRR